MLHPLEHVRDHHNPLADTPALASCQAPQLGRPRFAAKKPCRHTPSPKHGTLAHQLYHICGSPEAGITPYRERLVLPAPKECPMNDLTPCQQTMLAAWPQHTHAEFVLKDADA